MNQTEIGQDILSLYGKLSPSHPDCLINSIRAVQYGGGRPFCTVRACAVSCDEKSATYPLSCKKGCV